MDEKPNSGEASRDRDPAPQEPDLSDWLTLPGRILLILTIALWGAVFCWYCIETWPELNGSMPLIIWVGPTTIGGFLFYMLTAFLLEKIGIKIFRK